MYRLTMTLIRDERVDSEPFEATAYALSLEDSNELLAEAVKLARDATPSEWNTLVASCYHTGSLDEPQCARLWLEGHDGRTGRWGVQLSDGRRRTVVIGFGTGEEAWIEEVLSPVIASVIA